MIRKYDKSTAAEIAEALQFGDYAFYKELRIRLSRNPHDLQALEQLHRWHKFAHRRFLVCDRIYRNGHARGRRLNKRITSMFDDYEKAYFITLTFGDHDFDKDTGADLTCPETRRQAVRRFLKSVCKVYIANKDFGKKNEREHYHAVCAGFYDDATLALVHDKRGAHTTLIGWDRGFSNWESIGLDVDDTRKVAKYIAKLQNHATKETAAKERMIYSRRTK